MTKLDYYEPKKLLIKVNLKYLYQFYLNNYMINLTI